MLSRYDTLIHIKYIIFCLLILILPLFKFLAKIELRNLLGKLCFLDFQEYFAIRLWKFLLKMIIIISVLTKKVTINITTLTFWAYFAKWDGAKIHTWEKSKRVNFLVLSYQVIGGRWYVFDTPHFGQALFEKKRP